MNERRLTYVTCGYLIVSVLGVLAGCSGEPVTLPTATTAVRTQTPSGTVKPPKPLDDSAVLACDDLARGWKTALTVPDRLELTRAVNKWAQFSTVPGIADGGKALARTYAGGDEAWTLAGDTFATACLRAGWPK